MNYLELQISLLAFYGYCFNTGHHVIYPRREWKHMQQYSLIVVSIEGQCGCQHHDCTHRHTFTNKKQLLNCHRKTAYFFKYSIKIWNQPPLLRNSSLISFNIASLSNLIILPVWHGNYCSGTNGPIVNSTKCGTPLCIVVFPIWCFMY